MECKVRLDECDESSIPDANWKCPGIIVRARREWQSYKVVDDLFFVRLALLSPTTLRTFTLHIPKSTLVRGEGSVVPHIDEDTLRTVLIRLILDLLHIHLHTILGENDMLLLHLLTCGLTHVLDDAVDDVSDARKDSDEEEEENERDDVGFGHCVLRCDALFVLLRGTG